MRLIIPDHARRRARERDVDLQPFVAVARRLTPDEAHSIPARRVALRMDANGPVVILEMAGDPRVRGDPVFATVLAPDADLGTTPVLTWSEPGPGAGRLTRARWREMQAVADWHTLDAATAELRAKLLEDVWAD